MKNKITGLQISFILSLTFLNIGCSAADTVITKEAIGTNEPASIVNFDTVDSEEVQKI